jgi:hypothetical protein
MKKLVELKLLVAPGNPNKYVFANKEYDEVMRLNLDFQTAIEYIQEKYMGVRF